MTPNDDNDAHRRLELLEDYDILNTPPEPEFDDIVLVASEACGTPVALVSLVEEDRQWFKARRGFEACDTPMSQSVCADALSSADLLIIPDLTLDPRTKANTLVTEEPHIRFYAGAPLVSPEGIALGTLCVIDTKPRPDGLTASQQTILSALSRQVVALLEGRRLSNRKDELFRRQKGMSASIRAGATKTLAAQEAGRVGTFDVPVSRNFPISLFEQMVVPSDRGIQSTDITRRDANVEYRINAPSKGIRWISRHAAIERDTGGRPVRMLGTVQDITDAKRTVLRTHALLELGDRRRDLDPARELFDIPPEWCAEDVTTIAGRYEFKTYTTLLDDLKRGQPIVVSDVATDPRMIDHAELLLGLDARVIVIVPILDHGRFTLMAFVHHDEPFDWSADDLAFIRSVSDRVHMAIARLQSEADQETLNREIGHRLKNTFAMVQAIATQTLRPVTERVHVQIFEKRLFALSSAHDILLNDNAGATVRALVEGLGEALARSEDMEIGGPDIPIGPRGALSMALLLHELGTNALKYGALSRTGGVVKIHWSVDKSGAEHRLKFLWRESGGPPTSEPERRGFGSKLIQMGLIGTGGVELRYDISGFSAEMSASLQQLQQEN
ncbi:GAF domain-containing protein [Rhizobium wenxiniae]|uniref:GAF domain-containing protein n=1 Tax=Rhizobium wenxiniae TaxID=1737357 RepID=UPI003C1A1A6C